MSRIKRVNEAKSETPEPPKPMPEWVRVLLMGLAGAALGALCQFIPIAPLKAVCVAVSGVVSSVPIVGPPDAGM